LHGRKSPSAANSSTAFSSTHLLWIPGSKEISVESRQWIDSIGIGSKPGYPPPPSIFGIITLAQNSRQNTFFKELNSQNLENKELSLRGLTLWALHPLRTMIARTGVERQGWMSHDWRIRLWKKDSCQLKSIGELFTQPA
jgi:hypothetical protein